MKPKSLFTLRFSILTIFLCTFVVLISSIIIINWLTSYRAVETLGERMMKHAANAILKELSLQITPAYAYAKLTQSLIEKGIINDQFMQAYTLYVAKHLPNPKLPNAARVAAWGDRYGDSVETSIEPDGTFSTAIIQPSRTPPKHVRVNYDLSDHIIKQKAVSLDYDPRRRPWYISAEQAKKIIWSDVFLSYPYLNPSIAVSVPIYKNNILEGVFEIEVKLVALSNFLASLDIGKNSTAFIVNAKDELIAFPGMEWIMGQKNQQNKLATLENTEKPWLTTAFLIHHSKHSDQFKYDYAGQSYLAAFVDIPEFSNYGWQIGVVIPENNFVGPLIRVISLITLSGLVVLMIGVIIAIVFSKRISNPIKLLIDEAKKIRDFHLEGETVIRSKIKEVDQLGSSINSMKMNLRSFQKYMPADLVRQLIRTGKDIQLGGTKKEITIFFSDIQNFTTISETLDPEKIMAHLCDYFNEISTIILEEKGTIDKYIGDSVMAFWGDPLPDEAHCFHACFAALRCKKRLDELNTLWKKQGKPEFITRMGVHTGVAIVGNIGSLKRVNYTALGDSINIASRLEGMNKIYGTNIIVSERVVELLEDRFVFRLLDCISPRGRKGSHKIYELMADSVESLSFDFIRYHSDFKKGFQTYQHQHWDEAIGYFQQCLTTYPKDELAPFFIKRCDYFKKNPPATDWDGVWRL